VKVAAISRRVANNNVREDVEMSALDLFRHGGTCGGGWTLEAGGSAFIKYGACKSKCFPDGGDEQPCCSESRFVINTTRRLTSDAAVKDWISTRGAVWAAMTVCEDFFNVDDESVYRYEYGSEVGGHAVCLCGYDDTKGAWLLMNSWSNEWGTSGFCWIGYGECGIIRSYAAYGMEVTAPPQQLMCSITPKTPIVVVGKTITLDGNPVGGKAPYEHRWVIDTENGAEISTFGNKAVITTEKCGRYRIGYQVTDSEGTTQACSTTMDVVETPPIVPDIVLTKTGRILVQPLYISLAAKKTNLMINGKDAGPIKKAIHDLGEMKAGDTLGFALKIDGEEVHEVKVTEMTWANKWYVKMGCKEGSTANDVTLYVYMGKPAKVEVEKQKEEALEEFDEIMTDIVTRAMGIGMRMEYLRRKYY
jgi:hypothetical protein